METFKYTPEYEIDPLIESLAEPIRKIIDKVRNDLDSGQFSVIIGEDASGRLPALIFKDIVDFFNSECGEEKSKIYFLAGSKDLSFEQSEKKIQQIIEFLKSKNLPSAVAGKKVLIVTDQVSTGQSLTPLIRAFESMGIDYEIAALHVLQIVDSIAEVDTLDDLQRKFGDKLHWGITGETPIFNRRDLGGVIKNTAELHASALRKVEEVDPDTVNNNVRKSREAKTRVVEKIIEEIA